MGETSVVPSATNQVKSRMASISRRTFLRNASIVTAGALVAACRVGRDNPPVVDRVEPAVLEARVPATEAAAQVQELPPALSDFLALSALLTGVDNLDPTVGALYLQSLQNNPDFTETIEEVM